MESSCSFLHSFNVLHSHKENKLGCRRAISYCYLPHDSHKLYSHVLVNLILL